MTVIKRVRELRLGDKLAKIHGNDAAVRFSRSSRGDAEIVKLHAPVGVSSITITALVAGSAEDTVLEGQEPVEVVSPESTPETAGCQLSTHDRNIKRAGDLLPGDVLSRIHGRPAQAELTVIGNTARLGHEGSATVTTVEHSDPEQPASKKIKVTAQAPGDSRPGQVCLAKGEPVEVEGPAAVATTSG